jgi:hypothetical protein
MNADPERRLLTRAHALASDTADLAEEVTSILGGARAARLDPDALTGLAGAALALGAGSLSVYQAETARYASDGEMAAAIEDADDVITGHARAVARLATETTTGLDDARDALGDAYAERDNARAMAVSVPCAGCHGARAAAIAAAEQHIGGAEDRIAYAQAAARVLDTAAKRLRRALTCLRRVTTDLAETYEAVYDLRHRGQVMPKDGDWLTGQAS